VFLSIYGVRASSAAPPIPRSCYPELNQAWNGKHPVVELVTGLYSKGIRLSAKAMKEIEAQVERLPKLRKWFVDIHGDKITLG
jgi:hypothetical protein